MDGVLCPVVVGRSVELAALAGLVADTADGRGGLAVLVGEAGVGKSRLAREAAALAAGHGLLVLFGRAVPAGSPLPFRPLTEALLVASRGKRPPDSPDLTGFSGQLARLVPDWGDSTVGADDSPVLVGEAVVRLLRLLGGTAGCLLVLEDLHWVDPEARALTWEDGRWGAEQAPTPSVPASFAASLGTRLQTLDPDARHVLAAAAVLGRRFDWDLLPGGRRGRRRDCGRVAASSCRRPARRRGRPAVPVPPRPHP